MLRVRPTLPHLTSPLSPRIACCMQRDQHRLHQPAALDCPTRTRIGQRRYRTRAAGCEDIGRSTAFRAATPCGGPSQADFPDDLPVVQRRREIADLIAAHQVIVLCGETGSGKTTQLPKICLDTWPRRLRDDRPHPAAADRRPVGGHAHRRGTSARRWATPSGTKSASATTPGPRPASS